MRDLREFVNLEKTFLRARAIDVKQNAAFEVFFQSYNVARRAKVLLLQIFCPKFVKLYFFCVHFVFLVNTKCVN